MSKQFNNMSLGHYRAFVDLVEKLREAQKDYFRTRDARALSTAMSLEKQVDKAIIQFGTSEKQQSLF